MYPIQDSRNHSLLLGTLADDAKAVNKRLCKYHSQSISPNEYFYPENLDHLDFFRNSFFIAVEKLMSSWFRHIIDFPKKG